VKTGAIVALIVKEPVDHQLPVLHLHKIVTLDAFVRKDKFAKLTEENVYLKKNAQVS
jgi:hypothetical protein